MDDNPGSSESDRIPRAPGPALHQFLINRAERIQRQKNDQQSQDARTKASTNSSMDVIRIKKKRAWPAVETIYKRQYICLFGESNRRSALLETDHNLMDQSESSLDRGTRESCKRGRGPGVDTIFSRQDTLLPGESKSGNALLGIFSQYLINNTSIGSIVCYSVVILIRMLAVLPIK
ncbi:hypothetical protein ACET3Z_001888 [Daucus carota]